MKFNIFGYIITIDKLSPVSNKNKDFESMRKLEMRNWVRHGHAPEPKDIDKYNKEILGFEK